MREVKKSSVHTIYGSVTSFSQSFGTLEEVTAEAGVNEDTAHENNAYIRLTLTDKNALTSVTMFSDANHKTIEISISDDDGVYAFIGALKFITQTLEENRKL